MGIKSKPRKVNPFELKFNKSKHDILGRKKGAQVGAPTQSRKRAYEQREKTLGVEYDRKNKISKIVDKRVGERDSTKTDEEKTAMRFVEERTKNFKRAAKYNLGEDEELTLTHGGKALSDIEKYDKSMISDSEDDEDQISSKMVKIAHFGGGDEKSTEDKVKEKISREDMISNLIAKTKMARNEKQSQKDELEMMTENLDAKFSNLMQKLTGGFRPTGREKLEKDDFDKLAFTLKTESDPRATPANRKLTEDELAQEDRANLERLEAARLNSLKNSHQSVDMDVDVNAGKLAKERKNREKSERFEVRFNEDGKMIREEDSDEDEAEGSDEEEEEAEDSEEDLDDLLEEDEDELESEGEEESAEKQTKKKEVPFVFEMPKNYKKFCELLEQYSDNMSDVLERLVKCHHPSLKEGNKKLLNKMFLLCLRWFDDMSREDLTEQVIQEMDLAQKTMFDLLKFDIQYGVRCIRALIRQNWKNRQEKDKSTPASFSIISLLRLVAGLFPVSDIWHPVVIPAFFLATNVISNAKIANLRALSRQICLAHTILDYVSETRKYVPELVSFVKSALLLAISGEKEFSTSGFPITAPYSEMLVMQKPQKCAKIAPISISAIFDDEKSQEMSEDEENLKLSILRSICSLTQNLRVMYSSQNETYNIVFRPFLEILSKIDLSQLPTELSGEIDELKCAIRAECDQKRKLTQLSLKKTEKSMLKMLEPRFEWDFDPERPNKGKKWDEKKVMQKQLKNEQRGAIKELRKDTAFLARKQMSNVKSRDLQRKNATKRLMGGLMQQQGEWNKEMRTKDVETKKEAGKSGGKR
ncbi:unnamed protein product [Caenorhabditis angaria]|uniref:Nucleolar protein 14 n=1 Tax=Caenorhabditis angaria TaxID=860376 RepID=A0A9P1I7U3_9PELO|nr:unnamed protein product [Caenorhabditis angaria]